MVNVVLYKIYMCTDGDGGIFYGHSL